MQKNSFIDFCILLILLYNTFLFKSNKKADEVNDDHRD